MLSMYGKIPSFKNRNLCISTYPPGIDSIRYLFNGEGRILGCLGVYHTYPENSNLYLKYSY